ncbi:hypothetical protein ACE6H2_010412 [Prunus campanulata]
MPCLLAELLIDIVTRLSPKDLVSFMCVSKEWKATIQDPQFAISHLQRSIKTKSHPIILLIPSTPMSCYFSLKFSDSDTTSGKVLKIKLPWEQPLLTRDLIFGYCNGLVCIHDGEGFLLWNPSIHKFKRIPSSPSSIHGHEDSYGGFGYDSVNDDYKLVSFLQFHPPYEVHVYSLKSDAWKIIQAFCPEDFVLHSNGVFLKGALHWLVHHETDDERMIILTLDLSSEDFSKFPVPFHMFPDLISLKSGTSDLADLISLVMMGGYLCIYLVECRSKALIMKEYKVVESWTKFYSFDKWVYDYKPLMLSSCGKMVLFEEDSSRLAWYDLENGTRKPVRIYGMPEIFDTITSVGSIHLLGSLIRRRDNF